MTAMMDPEAAAITRYGDGPLVGAIVVAGTWHIFADLRGTIAGWAQYRWPAVVVVVWVVFLLVGLAAAVRLLRRTAAGYAMPILGIVVLTVASAFQTASCRPDQAFTLGHWTWANFGWFAILVVWRLRIGWLLAAMGLQTIVTLVVLSAMPGMDMDRIAIARYFTVVYGAGAIEVGVAWGARVLENRVRQAALARADRLDNLIARASAEAVHADRHKRYEDVGNSVRQLLMTLSTAGVRPIGVDIRRRCAIEAGRLRRLIAEHDDVPSPLVHELRACADIAERRGVEVSFEVTGPLLTIPLAARRALTDAPMHLLAAARSRARVTVCSSLEGEVELSVVADSDVPTIAAQRIPGFEATWEREDGATWLRTRWTKS